MAFEKFDKKVATAVNKDEQVTVLTNGLISLTWRAFEMLGEPQAVEFFYDRARGVVALSPTNKENTDGYAVRLPRDDAKGKVTVRGTALFKYYGIDISKTFKSKPVMEDNLLCFEVPQGTLSDLKVPDSPQISADDSQPNEVKPI